ncbi:MAG: hypothetical protein EA406_09825 [Rhodospirillales bacterium]|nr:MAG: hypothetical protein EA406_09825 [Rhodospirillales bacterium]
MTGNHDASNLSVLEQELATALEALTAPGAGARGNLECRASDLQQRYLATPAKTLDDVESRLRVIRDIVAGLGEPGYLLHLVDATLADLRALRSDRNP